MTIDLTDDVTHYDVVDVIVSDNNSVSFARVIQPITTPTTFYMMYYEAGMTHYAEFITNTRVRIRSIEGGNVLVIGYKFPSA